MVLVLFWSQGKVKKVMMFYLKVKRYIPEIQEVLANISEEKKDGNDEK